MFIFGIEMLSAFFILPTIKKKEEVDKILLAGIN